MTTGDTELPNEPLYLPIEVEGFDGFAEAIRSLKIAGVGGNSALGGHALTLIKDRELENAKNQTCDSLLSQVAGQALSPEMRMEMEKRIHSALGNASSISEVRAIAASISAEIREAGSWSAMEKNLNDQQTQEQKLEDLMNAYRDESAAARNDLKERGYSDTPDNEKKLKDLWTKLEDLKPGSEEWNKVRNEIYTMDSDYFARVEKDALAHKDYATAAKAHEYRVRAEEQQKIISNNDIVFKETNLEVISLRGQQKIQKTTSNFHFDEDEEPSLTQQSPIQQPMPIAKAEAIDIGNMSSPKTPGGKPSGGREIG